MRVLVTGSRNWTDEKAVRRAMLFAAPMGMEVLFIHGGAEGADTHAQNFIDERRIEGKLWWSSRVYRPRFDLYPKHVAPLKRNDEMLDTMPDLCLAFMLGIPTQGGTLYTFNGARERGIPVILYNWPGDPVYRKK